MTQELPKPVPNASPDDDRTLIQRAYRGLLKSIKTTLTYEESQQIRAAYEMAVEAHREQRRKSGEPYILHPIAVAQICVEEIGLGPTAVICALLHDVVEDTDVKLNQIEKIFGKPVARIVDGLTKLDGLHDSASPQAENFKKVLTTMLSDIRVVLIKMADRLHNLRTIRSMAHHKQLKIAAETDFIYAPLAHRLGLYAIKTEFQEICLKITRPEEYHEIARKLNDTLRARNAYIELFNKPILQALDSTDIRYRVVGRPKSIYSIWNKLRVQNVGFEEIYDLFAIRIIVDVPQNKEKSTCFYVYSVVTDYYPPIADRWKDWISQPKSNGYESLHTTVVGPERRFVEVQIRSERMDEIAERGFAAHWKYKGVNSAKSSGNDGFEKWLDGIREILENPEANAVEFVNDIQSSLFVEEIRTFSPKGDLFVLPDGATALDFAFAVHSEVGCRTIGVKVNNIHVPLGTKLKNGDQVQAITRADMRPSPDWLTFVKTGKAQSRIRAALKDDYRKAGEVGKEMLERKLAQLRVDFDQSVEILAKKGGFLSRLELFFALSKEKITLTALLKPFKVEAGKLVLLVEEKPVLNPPPLKKEPSKNGVLPQIVINDDPSTIYHFTLATCCNPVKGDPIFAFTSSSGVKIHRTTCQNATNLMANYGYRILKAEWGGLAGSDFVVELIIRGIDTGPGVIERLSRQISTDLRLNMRSFNISSHQNYFECRLGIVVSNASQVQMAIISLKNLEGVSSVWRADE